MHTIHKVTHNGHGPKSSPSRGIVQGVETKRKKKTFCGNLPSEIFERLIAEAVATAMALPSKEVVDDLETITPTMAAKLLKLSRAGVYKRCSEGRLPAIPMGDSVRIRPRVLYALLLAKEKIYAESIKRAA